MGKSKWTWTVLIASGTLAWACGGDDDGNGSDGAVTSTGGSGGSGGTEPTTHGGSGGSSGSAGTGGSAGTTSTTTSDGGSGGSSTVTDTTGTDSGGSAGSAGASGAAGMAGAAGDTGVLTIEQLCEADCAKLEQVGCEDFDASTCVQDFCMYFYNPSCEAEYREFLECDAAADVSAFHCDAGLPSFASTCDQQFQATFCGG